MTSQAQAKAPLPGVRGLVFVGFPLHPAGKPATERAEHLAGVAVPMLFLQGTRDELADARAARSRSSTRSARARRSRSSTTPTIRSTCARSSGRNDAQVREAMLDATVAWMATPQRPAARPRRRLPAIGRSEALGAGARPLRAGGTAANALPATLAVAATLRSGHVQQRISLDRALPSSSPLLARRSASRLRQRLLCGAVDPRTGQPYPDASRDRGYVRLSRRRRRSPVAAQPPKPTLVNVRLYPLNAQANKGGMLAAQVVDNNAGHGSFTVPYLGDTLQGESTRVDAGYPSFGIVHQQVLGAAPRMVTGRRGSPTRYGAGRQRAMRIRPHRPGPGHRRLPVLRWRLLPDAFRRLIVARRRVVPLQGERRAPRRCLQCAARRLPRRGAAPSFHSPPRRAPIASA